MTINAECSECKKTYRVKDSAAGKTVKCKSCGNAIAVFLSPHDSGSETEEFLFDESGRVPSKSGDAKDTKLDSVSLPLPLVKYVTPLIYLVQLEAGLLGWFMFGTVLPEVMKPKTAELPVDMGLASWFFGMAAYIFLGLFLRKQRRLFIERDQSAMLKLTTLFAVILIVVPVLITLVLWIPPPASSGRQVGQGYVIAGTALSIIQIAVVLPYFYFVGTSVYRKQFSD